MHIQSSTSELTADPSHLLLPIQVSFQGDKLPEMVYACIYKNGRDQVEIHYEQTVLALKEKQCTLYFAGEKIGYGYFYKVIGYAYEENALLKIGELEGPTSDFLTRSIARLT